MCCFAIELFPSISWQSIHDAGFVKLDSQLFTHPHKVIANLLLAVIMTTKRLLPFQFRAYTLMHKSAAFFLNNFVSPEACYLIVRHLCIGSNIINFLIDNGPDTQIEKSTLYPRTVNDLADNAFLEHDFILYNFVLDYNEAMLKILTGCKSSKNGALIMIVFNQ